jgi:hypothetical protein
MMSPGLIIMTMRSAAAPLALLFVAVSAWHTSAYAVSTRSAQVPQPFPKPGEAKPAQPQKPGTLPPVRVEPPLKPGEVPTTKAPTDVDLGLPVYPSAEFLGSYDAGRGQRYFIFGTNAPFTQIVEYYKSALKQRGELGYQEPPIHMFEVGRFREETMVFPPGVTVKDYSWPSGAGLGYLNPKRGAQPDRFKTIIQLVPVPAATR